jgi:hypothetical protein
MFELLSGLAIVAFVAVLELIQPDTTDPATGQPYTQPTTLNGDGVVTTDGETPVPPDALAAALGIEPNRYAMARVIMSEVGGLPVAAWYGVGWAIRNEAAHRGWSVLKLVTRATVKQSDGSIATVDGLDGFFGTQPHRYCSSAQDATDDAVAVADDVLSGNVDDPTGGARQWDSPNAFAALGETDDTAKREAAGLHPVYLPGVSSGSLRFWVA